MNLFNSFLYFFANFHAEYTGVICCITSICDSRIILVLFSLSLTLRVYCIYSMVRVFSFIDAIIRARSLFFAFLLYVCCAVSFLLEFFFCKPTMKYNFVQRTVVYFCFESFFFAYVATAFIFSFLKNISHYLINLPSSFIYLGVFFHTYLQIFSSKKIRIMTIAMYSSARVRWFIRNYN